MTILNDILDFSKIEAGKLEIENIEFDLGAVVQDCRALLQEPIKKKGLSYSSHISPAVPAMILGDPIRIRQVLLNLLSNAIKFTPSGAISLRVDCEPASAGKVTLRFEVRDSGIGMDPATIARLFSSFSQADTSTTRRYGGTGLGLAISKRLIQSMAGDIEVASQIGKGTCFSFHIEAEPRTPNLEPSPAPDAQRAEPRSTHSMPQSSVVLLAEDNPVNQRVASGMLRRLGFTVDIASNGVEAVTMARTKAYDLILMDCQMPEMDGFEAAEAIRKLEPTGVRTPIVAATANAFLEDRARCFACGMDDYMVKPIVKTDLEAILQKWVGVRV